MKIMYVNCGFRNEYESDLRSNEHYLGSCESKARKKKQNKTKATTTTTTKKTGFEPVTEVTRNCVQHLS